MKRYAVVILLAGLLAFAAALPPSTQAAGSAGIYASCINGARVNLGGSGIVTVTFYRLNASAVVRSVNLGGGMSTTVYSGVPGSYSSVYANGNSSVYSAGCY